MTDVSYHSRVFLYCRPQLTIVADIQAYLKQLNGQGTVPHVYIGQEFIGGCSELQAVPKDELKKKLSKK
jgi:glutaredoxin-related protein